MKTEPYNSLSDCPLFLAGDAIEIWYVKPEFFRQYIFGDNKGFDPMKPEATHELLGALSADSLLDGRIPSTDKMKILNELFYLLQGEKWSPNGEANHMIRQKGLAHTSMCVGDVICFKNGQTFMVKPIGWEQIFKKIEDGSSLLDYPKV